MSYINTATEGKFYIADAIFTPAITNTTGFAVYDFVLFKNVPTYINDIFPSIEVDATVLFTNGSYLKITSIDTVNQKYVAVLFDSEDNGIFQITPSYNPTNRYYYTFLAINWDKGLLMPIYTEYRRSWGSFEGAAVFPDLTYLSSSDSESTYPLYVATFRPNSTIDFFIDAFSAIVDSAHESIYFPGEESVIGGGTGSFDSTSDAIDFPSPPTLSAVTAGFITLFAPTLTQLNGLSAYLWSEDFDLTVFKKMFENPMDAIIGLSIVPVSVPISGASEVKVGFIGTGVTMNVAASQYVTVDCGSLSVSEYWGSALDYAPFTKFSIYLPYIGTRELNTDDVMGKTIHVKYNIDILSGSCTAMIKCGDAVLYQYSGSCALSIPIAARDFTQLITAGIQLASVAVTTAATGGASAAGLVTASANAVSAMKPNIQHTGAVSGAAGMLGVQQPYLIWELPRQSLAGDYNKFVGYPSNITALLSTLTGYTQIESVHLENIPATQSELAEIESLLKEGVII